jgi:hypothetical protein
LLTVGGGSPAEYVLPVFELSYVARLEKAILVERGFCSLFVTEVAK